ncbi:hypothetical protein HDK90DRAFT_46235 [Phyllosticta capitalensis]|uniref:Secreted protein n=1 Tax=Phyllosticta capitalensis TaxID=121624 RepID=A0ABR1Z5D6_9PEZI
MVNSRARLVRLLGPISHGVALVCTSYEHQARGGKEKRRRLQPQRSLRSAQRMVNSDQERGWVPLIEEILLRQLLW